MAKDEFGFEIKNPATPAKEPTTSIDEFGFPINTLDTQETPSGVDEFGFPIKTPEPPRPDYDLGDLAGKAVRRGFKRTGSTLFDTLPALGLAALGFDEAAERQLEEARATEEAIQRDLPAQFESFRDVDWKNPLDIGKFVVEKVGEQSANLLTVLVPGAGGAAAGSKVAADRALKTLIEKKASKKARDRILKSARAKGANIGQVGGVFLGSYSLNAPETFRGIYDQTGNLEVGASLIAGTVNASLDSIFPITLMRSFSPAGRAGIVTKILERSGMNPGLARSAVTKVLGSAAIEGVTEATQEAVNITAENFVQEHSFAFDSDDYERMLEGGITGAAAGGGFRVVGESVQSVKKGIDEYIKEKADAGPPVGSIPPEEGSATLTKTETETQKKVRLAQELNDRQRAERIAGELEQFEKDAIQAEYQEKLNTAEGVNDIIDNFDKYFAGKSKKEKNQIRTKLQQRRADLEAGDPVEESTVEVEPKKEEPKAATKSQTKEQSKEEIEQALEQQVLDFVTQQSILGKKVTKNQLVKSKDFNIGPKRAGEILKRLRSDFKIQGDKGRGNQIEYASLDFVPLPKKKKDYAGIKKADPRAVPLKVGQRSKKEGLFSGPASTSINHMLNLAGVLGVNATNMDANLQKRLIQEFNKYVPQASQNLQEVAEALKENIKFQRSIDNEYFTQTFSQKSIDALKEYAEETRNDYNTRQRIAGATRASDQTGVAGGTGAPILSPEKTTAEVVEETDRTPVAAVGPDTGQLTGAERGIYPSLGGQNFTEGKKITVKTSIGTTVKGFYRVENTPDGPQGTVVYSRIGQEPGIQSIYPEDIVTDVEVDAAQKRKLKTTREGDPRDKEIINKLKSKRTLGQVLAILDKEKITTTQKELVTVLLSLPNIKSVKFNIVKDSDLEPGTFGEYDVKNNFIKVGFSGDVQAVLHEATHAATANQLTKHISRDGKGKTPVGRKLIALYNTTVDTLASRDFIQNETFSRDFAAELENIDEFVAGAFNNPAFQEILAQVESPTSDAGAVAILRAEAADPKGKDATRREIDRMEAAFRGPPLEETIDSAWAGFVKAVKQIINPNFKLNLRDSVLNDVIALAPELFVGPNPAEQAQGPQGSLFIKDKDKAKTISELDVKSLEELEVLPEIRSYTIPEMNETLSTDISDAEADIALENIDNLNRQAAGTNIVTPLEKELDDRYDINAGKDAFLINGHAAPLKYNEPGVILRNYNKLMDLLNRQPIASEGIGKSIVDTLSNLPAAVARAFVGFLSLPQIFELIGNRIPALKPLYGLLENKAIITKNGREDIGFVIQFVENITDKYKETPQGQAILKRWNRVLLKLSAEDVDPEAALAEDVDLVELTETNPTAAALVREYDQLPQDLKDAANRMVNDLRQRYEQLLAATIEAYPDREAKIRKDFAMKPYYLPLVRKGDYWYKYIDSETGRQAYSSAGSESSRRLEMQRIINEGIGTEVEISTRVESARLSGAPPSAFVTQLKDSINDLELPTGLSAKDVDKIKKTFIQDIEENYLQLFPAQSLQNSQRHRKAVPGYIEDVVLAYADGAPRISNSFGNTLFNRQILSAINSVQKQAAVPENQNNALVQAAAKSILNRSSFFVNPVAQGYAALAAFGSFYWFLGLNPSSALINLTQLPLVVQPFLAAEYGGIVGGQLNSLKALNDARKLYTTGGVEQTRKKDFLGKQFLPDMTMAPFKVDLKTGNKIYVGKNKNLFKPGGLYADLFKKAEESATIRRGISYEATEISRQPNRDVELTKPNRIGAKVNSLVGYLFQNSERFNREITLVAAYNLEMEKLLGKNWKTRNKTTPEYRRANNQAVAKAIDLTVRAHSHALPEVGPEYFQDGPMKVMTIFKRFAQQQIYLTSRLLLLALPRQIVKEKDNANMTAQEKEAYKNERKLAISRLMGIYAYSWILAGVQGMPFYGLAYLLYELVADDEDEPANLDTKLMQDLGNTVYRGPFNKALGIDISRRTGFRDMVFRTDEQRLEEVGFFTYSIETILGPAYSAGQRFAEGGTELFTQGLSIRSLEKMLPTALSNSLKAVRQSTDGITNVRGVSIADDPNLYQSIMQVMGFTSLEVSEAYARANAIKGPERKLYKRRSRLLLEYWLALRSGDSDAVQEVKDEILDYNTVVPPSFRISNDTIRRSMKNRRKIEMRAIDGVDVKNRSELELIYGIDED